MLRWRSFFLVTLLTIIGAGYLSAAQRVVLAEEFTRTT